MRLVDKDGKELVVGNTYFTFRNEEVVLVSFQKPHKPASSGKVFVRMPDRSWTQEFYPSVIGAEWIEREDRA